MLPCVSTPVLPHFPKASRLTEDIKVTNACLSLAKCVGITIWGVRDPVSLSLFPGSGLVAVHAGVGKMLTPCDVVVGFVESEQHAAVV